MATFRSALLKGILTEINNIRKSGGIFSAGVQLLRIIKGRLFFTRAGLLFAHSLEDDLADVRLPAGLDIREATLDDLHLFESADKPLEVMLCKRLMDTGAKCLVALSDNQLAAYVWFAAQVDPAIHLLYLPLAHDEVYVFDSFTMPAFRRQGIQTVLHQIMFRMLRQRGYRRVLILVGLDNQPSLRMHDQLYQPIGRLTRIKLFRLMVFHYDPALPGHARRMIKWLGF